MAPRASLDRCRKSRPTAGFDSRTVQPVASRYTDYATRPTSWPLAFTESLTNFAVPLWLFILFYSQNNDIMYFVLVYSVLILQILNLNLLNNISTQATATMSVKTQEQYISRYVVKIPKIAF